MNLGRIFFAAAIAACVPALPAAAEAPSPVVVELFTSQGCSSCPPADAYLGELAKEPGVIALAFHVDYWDYIGWKDPFAKRWSTERQRTYTAALGNRYLYTPEMVIDGRRDAPGTERSAISQLINAEGAGDKILLTVTEQSDDRYMVKIPGSKNRGPATVWLVFFDREHITPVARGENEGRTLHDFNVVRELRKLGRYTGKAVDIPVQIALRPENGCAILLQADHEAGDGQGPILGATLIDK